MSTDPAPDAAPDSDPAPDGPAADASGARTPPRMRFSPAGVRAGFFAGLPVALGVAGYGLVFGILADGAGLSVAEAALMSATVLAGAAQLVAMELWADPVPVLAVVGTTVVVNLRYLLMGAALRPWFARLSAAQAYGSAFFMADENWALSMGEFADGSDRGAFLLGSGLAIWCCWVAATVAGALAGGAVAAPARYGLDFVLTAVFLAIAADIWEGRSDLLPWAVAFAAATAGAVLLPGRWYVLLGGAAGSAAEVVRGAR